MSSGGSILSASPVDTLMIPGAAQPPPNLIADLKARYGEPHRVYHTWQHIEALLARLRAHLNLVRNPTTVLWAILWHDAIYNPHRKDNEERSAELLMADGNAILDDSDLRLAARFVRASARHEVPDGLTVPASCDCGLFLDLDLSILAAPESVFDKYQQQIRKEYDFVPEDVFRSARAGVLRRLLQRPTLYFTPELARDWEGPARVNLKRSIARLAS